MKKIFPLILILGMLVSCSPKKTPDKLGLAVSLPAQAQILTELCDTDFRVITIIPPGTNPETYDPSMKERMALADAQAFFVTGMLPFETSLIGSLPGDVEVINTSEGIVPITGTHQHGHGDEEHYHEGDADPHITISYNNALIMAQNFTNALIKLNPEKETVYRGRLEVFTARIQALQESAREKLKQAGVHAFAVWHPSLSYFARDFGLHQISVGQESKEISLSSLSKIIEEAKEDSVRVFFFQKAYDSRQAESINSAIGSRLITIDPLAADWESQLNTIVDALTTDN